MLIAIEKNWARSLFTRWGLLARRRGRSWGRVTRGGREGLMSDLWREQAVKLILEGKSLSEICAELDVPERSTRATLPAAVREIEEQLNWEFGGTSEAADRELSVVLVEIHHELNLNDEASKTLQQKCIDRRRAAVRRIKAALRAHDSTQVTWQALLTACRQLIFPIRKFSVTPSRFS